MINIDDVPLIFPGQSILLRNQGCGYLDEINVIVLDLITNYYTLVTEDHHGQLIKLSTLKTSSFPASGNQTFVDFVWLLDNIQKFDAANFLYQCTMNHLTVEQAFNDMTSQLISACKSNCKHLLVYSSGACMICSAAVGATYSAHNSIISSAPPPTTTGQLSFGFTSSSWYPSYNDDESTPTIEEPSSNVKELRKKNGVCIECGDRGEWRNLALVCKLHGIICG